MDNGSARSRFIWNRQIATHYQPISHCRPTGGAVVVGIQNYSDCLDVAFLKLDRKRFKQFVFAAMFLNVVEMFELSLTKDGAKYIFVVSALDQENTFAGHGLTQLNLMTCCDSQFLFIKDSRNYLLTFQGKPD